jgi:hypothetical protein
MYDFDALIGAVIGLIKFVHKLMKKKMLRICVAFFFVLFILDHLMIT